MTYQQIEAFMAIIEKGSMTKAAETLYISQPALSHRISELENELGAELFVKKYGKRSNELTFRGTMFVRQAQKWMALWLETSDIMKEVDEEVICISSSLSLCKCVLFDIYNEIHRRKLPVFVKLMVADYTETYSKMDKGIIDYAVNS